MAQRAQRDFAANDALMLRALGVSKTFTLHPQGGVQIPALHKVDLDVSRGECIVLVGPSGAGKSSLLRCLYGNYLASAGAIYVRGSALSTTGAVVGAVAANRGAPADQSAPADERAQDGQGTAVCTELTHASPHQVIALRRQTLGYVSQFLHVIPRVSTLSIVAEPLVLRGVGAREAEDRARALLSRLMVPQRLWTLPPATFSGGEQQRVNIARGLIAEHPILLLDEPTASLDAENRDVVAELIVEARERGAAIVGIFHDEETRNKVATRRLELKPVLRAVA
ncbi:phosphonate C-P lyase system protein PhnL [Burkholderia sp. L27(2015)]|uniref:phosphonate C-P lyase system protein PhnL n=1 Tax=Burkholderia sp. L27(2015) TaxID=1641858 RepID=UPI0020B151A2|nr:ATP-binding cassette domain-containing protein [Burkholderia sp. L27(2015)]